MHLAIDLGGANPYTVLLVLFVGFLPGFAWLLFYLEEDKHPEPKRLIATTFIMGMASALVALIGETVLNLGILPMLHIERLSIISLICISVIEELSKFGATFINVSKSPYFDEPVDPMIYMVVAALGFATVENLGAVSGVSTANGAFISGIFHIATLRFVGATLLHSLVAAIIGYFWALDIRDFKTRKYIYVGLGIAILLHTIFNYLIIEYGDLTYILVFLSLIGFFVLTDFEKLRRKSL